MADKQAAEQASVGVNEFFGTLSDTLKKAMEEGVKAVNPKRDNPNYEADGVFTPKGVVKPELTRRIVFKGIVEDPALLTPEEITLYNQLPEGNHSFVINMAGLPREVKLEERQDGTTKLLRIDFPLSVQERAYMPPLRKLLRAIIAGATEID